MSSDFNTRILVKVIDDVNNEYPLIPLVSITPNFSTPFSHEHSTNADMVGKVRGNREFSFNLTCKATKNKENDLINPSLWLTELQLKELEFNILFAEQYTEGAPVQEWAFKEFSLNKCRITNGSPSNITLNGSPAAVFNGICSEAKIDDRIFNGITTIPT